MLSVAVNPKWGEPHKLAVSVGADKIVRLWDTESCTLKLVHHGHTVTNLLCVACMV